MAQQVYRIPPPQPYQAPKAVVVSSSGAQTYTYVGSGGLTFAGSATLLKIKAYPAGAVDARISTTQAANLKGFWKLTETSGASLADSSGNGKSLTPTGTYTLDQDMGSGGFRGVSFGGGYADIADSIFGAAATEVTLMSFVKSASSTQNNKIVCGWGNGNSPFDPRFFMGTGANGGSYTQNGDQLRGQITSDQDNLYFGANADVTPSTGPFNNSLHHICMTFVRSTRVAKLYVDGVEKYSLTCAAGAATDTYNFVGFSLARFYGLSGNEFSGILSRTAAWNKALTSTEISDISSATPGAGLTFGGSAATTKIKAYAPSGGLTLAGSATTTKTKAYAGSGGLTLAGSATLVKVKSYTASGGMTLGGAATLSKEKIYTASGGITLGGSAGLVKVKIFPASNTGFAFAGAATSSFSSLYTYAGSGGFTFAGAADLTKIKVFTASGGITFAGSADLSKEKVFVASGGIVFAGSAALAKTKAFAGSGGIVFGGSADLLKIKSYLASGGVQLGGAATTSFQGFGTTTYTYVGSGGLTLGGSAATSFVAATVTQPEETQAQTISGGSEWVRPRRSNELWRLLNRPPEPKPRIWEYRGSGSLRLNIRRGGRYAFDPIPPSLYEYDGDITLRISGAAKVKYHDQGALIRRLDEQFLMNEFEDLELIEEEELLCV
jgi:hypothetical protein